MCVCVWVCVWVLEREKVNCYKVINNHWVISAPTNVCWSSLCAHTHTFNLHSLTLNPCTDTHSHVPERGTLIEMNGKSFWCHQPTTTAKPRNSSIQLIFFVLSNLVPIELPHVPFVTLIRSNWIGKTFLSLISICSQNFCLLFGFSFQLFWCRKTIKDVDFIYKYQTLSSIMRTF